MQVHIAVLASVVLTAFAVRGGLASLSVSGDDERAFCLSWMPDAQACGYEVNVWTNGVVGTCAGTRVLYETFGGLTNRKNTATWTIDEVNRLGDYGRWSGETLRGYPEEGDEEESEGALTLGMTTTLGHLASAPLPFEGRFRLRVRMTPLTKDARKWITLSFWKDGTVAYGPTNIVMQGPEKSFADYYHDIEALPAGCSLRLTSAEYYTSGGNRNFGRVAISEIELVNGYEPGMETRVFVDRDAFVQGNQFCCAGVQPTVYGYSVASICEQNGVRVTSQAVTGSVDMADPPWLHCWRLSGFLPRPGVRKADFSSLKAISKATPWRNGIDCDRFYAFSDGAPVTQIGRNSGISVNRGLYATVTNENEIECCVLSMLATGGGDMNLVLPLKLDVAQSLESFSVVYRSHQVSFKENGGATTNAFSWCRVDDLGRMASADTTWCAMPEGDYVTAYDGGLRPEAFAVASAERSVALPVRHLPMRGYLCLRWHVPQRANSAMMGISGVRVTARLRDDGLRLIVR